MYQKTTVEDHEDDDEGTKETIDDAWSPPTTVYCGMLPLGERCLNAMTKGLRWNLSTFSSLRFHLVFC